MANPFEQLSAKAGTTDRSMQWYQANIRKLASGLNTPQEVMSSDLGKLKSSLDIGGMYMFVYEPKTKDRLPYWDTFPLCVPFDDAPGGFYGLNLHYLPPLLRAQLLDRLEKTQDKIPDKDGYSKMQVSWNLLKKVSRFPEVRPCVKRYITKNIRSRFLQVKTEHWRASIFMPTQNFVGAGQQKIYRDSREIING